MSDSPNDDNRSTHSITSTLGSSSRTICIASGIHVNSCPIRKTVEKHGLAGSATTACSYGCRFNLR